MRADDITSHDNNRQDAIDKLIQFCTSNNLSYNYTEKAFTITLPNTEPIPTASQLNPKRRRKFDITTWGDKGLDETDPDNPDNFKLNEGRA